MMDNFGLSDRLCEMDESDLTRDLMPDLSNMLQQEVEMVCQEFESEQENFDAERIDLVSNRAQELPCIDRNEFCHYLKLCTFNHPDYLSR